MEAKTNNITARNGSAMRFGDNPGSVHLTPPVDVFESEQEIMLRADFPGVSGESLAIRLDGLELVVEGEQAPPNKPFTHRPLLFQRNFRIPNSVDPEKVSAELKCGVLTVRLAKRETAKPRQIQVSVS